VKVAAGKYGIPVFQPDTLLSDTAAQLKKTMPDLFVVIAYGQLLKADILAIPRYYAVNLHASLLPRYRGAAPVNWALINGETRTGVTVMRLNERMDEGDVMGQVEVDILPDDNAVTLTDRLAATGAAFLVKTVQDIGGKIEKFTRQDPVRVSYARKLVKEDGVIDWAMPASAIHNRVRGLKPWPMAYTLVNGKKITIVETCVADGNAAPGVVVDMNGRLLIGTGKGILEVRVLQLEGKKPLDAGSFLRGYRTLKQGDRFGA
ncbi:MAG: methionyl-tRNA formyltransferase, partial [Candidatus Omnitrophica bacterium]|nr:methionyl-tRNA formyltransferase [Candidatus Omnitrophota bacterium]